MKYIINLLISIDQFVNTLLGGDPDMTISKRLGGWLNSPSGFKRTFATVICSALDKVDKNHCEDAKE
jgi:hypothetical protein